MKPITDGPDVRNHPKVPADGEDLEREWLTAVGCGDRRSFEHLYLRHNSRLASFLARHTSQRDLIDDIISETFWIVWRKAKEFRSESKVGTWIIGIAYRCMLKSLRGRAPLVEQSDSATDELLLDAAGAESNESASRELADWVNHGLALLPQEQRLTMELAYYMGQSCEEIAAVMNCAVGTVKARMFHARVRLRNTLPALGGDNCATKPITRK